MHTAGDGQPAAITYSYGLQNKYHTPIAPSRKLRDSSAASLDCCRLKSSQTQLLNS